MMKEEEKISSSSASPDRDRSFRPTSVESHILLVSVSEETLSWSALSDLHKILL